MVVATTVRDAVTAVMDVAKAGMDVAGGGEIFDCINFCSKEQSKCVYSNIKRKCVAVAIVKYMDRYVRVQFKKMDGRATGHEEPF